MFALDQKLKLAAETCILHSGLKFMCLVVHFHKCSFDFGANPRDHIVKEAVVKEFHLSVVCILHIFSAHS